MNIALITAAGKGERTKQDIPKQFLHIENKPLIIYTLEAFETHPAIDTIMVVCLEGWLDILWIYAKQYGISKLEWIVTGGASGQESIHNGIIELERHCLASDTVLIHDGNRSLVSQEIISNGFSVYAQYGSAVAAIPCTEVVFKSKDGETAEKEVPHNLLFRTQTPHIFRLEKLLWAHGEAERRGIQSLTATCALMQALGETIHFSRGSEKNIKITTVDDIDIFRALLTLPDNMYLKK